MRQLKIPFKITYLVAFVIPILVAIPLLENVLEVLIFSMQELLAQASGGGMFSCGFCEFKTYCSKVLVVC